MSRKASDEVERILLLKNTLLQPEFQLMPGRVLIGVESLDDAALIQMSDTESLVIASDFVRGSGFFLFQLGYLDYFDIGYYLVIANLSDIAAMGARPFGLTTIVRYTTAMSDDEFIQVFKGMKAAADTYGTTIVGGDIGGYACDVFAATAFGFVKTENALLRKNVKQRDLLCVTGTLGLPITALTYFKEVKQLGFTLSPQDEESLLLSWKRPPARITQGLILSENRIANACQDISDGLKASIEQMSAVSGKAFTIFEDKIPIHNITRQMADFLHIDPIQIAISASVDFELMFTISPSRLLRCQELFDNAGISFHVIGEVNTEGKNILVTTDAQKTDLPGVAWKQQTNDYLKQIIAGGSRQK